MSHTINIVPPTDRELIILQASVADDFIPGSGLVVYARDERSNRVRVMSQYALQEGWVPYGIVPDGYGPLLEHDRFWCLRQGPVSVKADDL